MAIHIVHKPLKHVTRNGKYTKLENALKKYKETRERWNKENTNWIDCYVGEDKK